MAKAARPLNGILRSSPVKFSQVLAAFERGPIKVQRDHEKRAKRATHLRGVLHQSQAIFSLVMWKGQLRLVDGYTRVQCVKMGKVVAPDRVHVIVYEDPGSEANLMALYDQFDSSAAQKKATDRYDEGLRVTEKLGQFTSHLMAHCPKSAPQQATDASSIRAGVLQAKQAMETVDKYGLRKGGHETLGCIAAYLAIARFAGHLASEAQDFIYKMNQQTFEPVAPTAGEREILRARAFQAEKKSKGSATGGSNVKALRNRILGAFVRYAGWQHLMPDTCQEALSLVEFETLMGQVLAKRK